MSDDDNTSEALRLTTGGRPSWQAAAAELRRLHAECDALRAELDAQRVYARVLCKAVDAATDFAGTVAGGSSWWDDVWADHAAALDRARARISDAARAAIKD